MERSFLLCRYTVISLMENILFVVVVVCYILHCDKATKIKWKHQHYNCKVMTFDLQLDWPVTENSLKSIDNYTSQSNNYPNMGETSDETSVS